MTSPDLDDWLDALDQATPAAPPAADELEQSVLAAFDDSGPLARLDPGYKPRAPQLHMSRAVARALSFYRDVMLHRAERAQAFEEQDEVYAGWRA